MKKRLYLTILLLAIVYCNHLAAQSQIFLGIDSVGVKTKIPHLDLFINALYKKNPWTLGADNIIVSEKIGKDGAWKKLEIQNVEPAPKFKTSIPKTTEANFNFLVDVSNKMTQNDLNSAKRLIKKVIDQYSITGTETFSIQPFSDNAIYLPKSVNRNILDQTLSAINLDNHDPWLYDNLKKYITRYINLKGKTIVLLISPGINQADSTATFRKLPSAKDIAEQLPVLLKDQPRFYIYPIAVGDSVDTKFLSQLPTTTSVGDDEFAQGDVPASLNKAIQGIEKVMVATHHLMVKTSECIFYGEERFYKIEEANNPQNFSAEFSFSKGSFNDPYSICYQPPQLIYLLIGLAIIGCLMGFFIFLLPSLRRSEFKRRYVKPYSIEGNRRHIDQMTGRHIEAGEPSVYKCSQVITFKTWVDSGSQCPNYPGCLNNPQLRCDGAGAPEKYYAFFDMQDPLVRRLNWLFFGAIGGYIGLMFYLLTIELGFRNKPLSSILPANTAAGSEGLEIMLNNALVGACFGMGLLFMLAWVEERGQSRRISWLRILLRTILGVAMSALIFVLGFYLQYKQILGSQLLGSLITWILFGLGIGFILSIKSTVPIGRGLLGGAIAGLITFLIRLLVMMVSKDFYLANVFAMIAMGAILGYTLVTIISLLEDFELEYLTPVQYRRIVPISRWLGSGLEMTIGTSPQSNIYVKWTDDNAAPLHAKLVFDKSKTYLTAYAETLVNNQIVPQNQKTPLANGDVLQLGRYSVTKMKYIEKRKTPIVHPTPPPSGKATGKGSLGSVITPK